MAESAHSPFICKRQRNTDGRKKARKEGGRQRGACERNTKRIARETGNGVGEWYSDKGSHGLHDDEGGDDDEYFVSHARGRGGEEGCAKADRLTRGRGPFPCQDRAGATLDRSCVKSS